MPLLKPLLADLHIAALTDFPDSIVIEAVTDDSRRCGPGILFVAIEGTKSDGHEYLRQAGSAGSPAALVGREVAVPLPIPLIRVNDTRGALARIAQRLAGDPSHAMTVVGITGTKGKTTVAYLMESIFEAAGWKSGVMGTVSYRWAGHVELEPAPQTTPPPTDVANYLKRMREAGVRGVAMEVSSHAIEQRRADGIKFAAAAMTNLTHEHLDYHHTMDEYARAKERLFIEVLPENPDGVAVFNLDDDVSRRFVSTTRAKHTLTFSAQDAKADVFLRELQQTTDGLALSVHAKGRELEVRSPMHGTFNAHNALTALALGLAVNIPEDAILAGLAKMPGAPGRFEFVRAGQDFNVIVDYAHTPDSLEKLLQNARGVTQGKLICVFGAGGDRDNTKRRPMGAAAAKLADEVIVTSDNPRTEDPERIATMVIEGVVDNIDSRRWQKQLDRRKAIEEALARAQAGDTVVIAGKGHEDYQIIGAEKIHFDDRETAREILMEIKK